MIFMNCFQYLGFQLPWSWRYLESYVATRVFYYSLIGGQRPHFIIPCQHRFCSQWNKSSEERGKSHLAQVLIGFAWKSEHFLYLESVCVWPPCTYSSSCGCAACLFHICVTTVRVRRVSVQQPAVNKLTLVTSLVHDKGHNRQLFPPKAAAEALKKGLRLWFYTEYCNSVQRQSSFFSRWMG